MSRVIDLIIFIKFGVRGLRAKLSLPRMVDNESLKISLALVNCVWLVGAQITIFLGQTVEN